MTFNLAALFERVADVVPEREAIVCGDRRMSFADLDTRSDRVAGALGAAGIGPGDRVAIALRNGPEYLELMLCAFKLSAVPVNVNYRYQSDELRHVLTDSEAKLVVHEPELGKRLTDVFGPAHPATMVARGEPYERWIAGADPAERSASRSDDDHYVLYTGGTTGEPKGVVWRHRDIFAAAMGGGSRRGSPITEADQIVDDLADPPNRVLLTSPLMHGTAQWFAFSTLLAGNTVVLAPAAGFDATATLDLVDAEGVSYLVVVGDAFAGPLVEALEADGHRWDLTTLTVILSGGATLSAPARRKLLEHLPWIIVVDSYGTSETGAQGSFVYSSGMDDLSGPTRFEPRTDTAVLDAALQPVRAGSSTIGRIARSGLIPLGYHGDPELDASTFPTIDGVRWSVTGDRAAVDADGRIVLLGRGSSTINSGGEKIHPDEVEAVLREHPAVLEAVVVGLPDERWGERVGAVVALRPGHDVSDVELATHCRGLLADFKTPRAVARVDRIHRSESGKPDYHWARRVITP